jgi:hypothetical protein
MHLQVDWLRFVRHSTHRVVPALAAITLVVELTGVASAPPALQVAASYLIAVVFSLITIILIGVCGWVVFLWDIDRLFYRLERKIDAQTAGFEGAAGEPDESLFGRPKDLLSDKVQRVRGRAVRTIEKAYWKDIDDGGVLAFPRPDIGRAIEHIDESRRDLLASLTDYVASMLPLGQAPAPIVSRMIFRSIAPEVKVRLYRRLVLRFLAQLGALFLLATLCFYLSILGWARAAPSVFLQPDVSALSVMLYQLDLMLRGGLFDFMEHTQRSVSPIGINQNAPAFVCYTLLFRMFVAVYVISSLVRVVRFVGRRWCAFLR